MSDQYAGYNYYDDARRSDRDSHMDPQRCKAALPGKGMGTVHFAGRNLACYRNTAPLADSESNKLDYDYFLAGV